MSRGKGRKTRLSKKQRMIMETLCAGNKDENGGIVSWLDLDQLLERLPYKTTKASMHFSVRYLIDKEMLSKGGRKELRRGRKRCILIPTHLGFSLVNVIKPVGYYEYDNIIETY